MRAALPKLMLVAVEVMVPDALFRARFPVPPLLMVREPESAIVLVVKVSVPTTVPLTKFPTDVREEPVTPLARVVPVSVPAAAATVILLLPSKETPLMVLGVARVVAVLALPVSPPVKVVVVRVLVLGLKVRPVPRFVAWLPLVDEATNKG